MASRSSEISFKTLEDILIGIVQLGFNWMFWLSIGLNVISIVLWLYCLQKLPISAVYPFVGLGIVLVLLGAHIVFGEQLPPKLLFGAFLIIFGLFVIGR